MLFISCCCFASSPLFNPFAMALLVDPFKVVIHPSLEKLKLYCKLDFLCPCDLLESNYWNGTCSNMAISSGWWSMAPRATKVHHPCVQTLFFKSKCLKKTIMHS